MHCNLEPIEALVRDRPSGLQRKLNRFGKTKLCMYIADLMVNERVRPEECDHVVDHVIRRTSANRICCALERDFKIFPISEYLAMISAAGRISFADDNGDIEEDMIGDIDDDISEPQVKRRRLHTGVRELPCGGYRLADHPMFSKKWNWQNVLKSRWR